jgi:hypothetical protein
VRVATKLARLRRERLLANHGSARMGHPIHSAANLDANLRNASTAPTHITDMRFAEAPHRREEPTMVTSIMRLRSVACVVVVTLLLLLLGLNQARAAERLKPFELAYTTSGDLTQSSLKSRSNSRITDSRSSAAMPRIQMPRFRMVKPYRPR